MASDPCPICALADHPDETVVFLNEDVMIVTPDPALAFGHVQVFPRRHAAIFEHMSSQDVGTLFATANTLSSVLFDLLRAQGTNIIMQNGVSAGQSVAHVSLHILPRRENDGLDFQWELAPANQQELQQSAAQLKDAFIPMNIPLMGAEKKPVVLERSVEKIGATS